MAKKTEKSIQVVPRDTALAATEDLFSRAMKGDGESLATVTKVVRSHTHEFEEFTNVAQRLQKGLVAQIGPDPLERVFVTEHVTQLRAALAGPKPTALERLLVERIVVNWLQVHHLDMRDLNASSRSFEHADFDMKRADRAQRRFLAAVKTLAEVRRLAVPAVQVNIAQRQLNVSTTGVLDGVRDR